MFSLLYLLVLFCVLFSTWWGHWCCMVVQLLLCICHLWWWKTSLILPKENKNEYRTSWLITGCLIPVPTNSLFKLNASANALPHSPPPTLGLQLLTVPMEWSTWISNIDILMLISPPLCTSSSMFVGNNVYCSRVVLNCKLHFTREYTIILLGIII